MVCNTKAIRDRSLYRSSSRFISSLMLRYGLRPLMYITRKENSNNNGHYFRDSVGHDICDTYIESPSLYITSISFYTSEKDTHTQWGGIVRPTGPRQSYRTLLYRLWLRILMCIWTGFSYYIRHIILQDVVDIKKQITIKRCTYKLNITVDIWLSN
jgi:hypothetical protein